MCQRKPFDIWEGRNGIKEKRDIIMNGKYEIKVWFKLAFNVNVIWNNTYK